MTLRTWGAAMLLDDCLARDQPDSGKDYERKEDDALME